MSERRIVGNLCGQRPINKHKYYENAIEMTKKKHQMQSITVFNGFLHSYVQQKRNYASISFVFEVLMRDSAVQK